MRRAGATTKRDFSDAEWGVIIFRSSFNALLKSILLPANYYRYPGGSAGIGLIANGPPQAVNFENPAHDDVEGEVIDFDLLDNDNSQPDLHADNHQPVNWVLFQGAQDQAPQANVNPEQILRDNRAKIGAGVNFFLGWSPIVIRV